MASRVLILCTGNSCRSQMAEGILNHLGTGEFEAFSAGTHPSAVNPLAVQTMDEIDIDISHHTSKDLEVFGDQKFDYVLTVCDRAKEICPAYPQQTRLIHWSFDDPAEAEGTVDVRLIEFRRVRDEIQEKLDLFVRSEMKE